MGCAVAERRASNPTGLLLLECSTRNTMHHLMYVLDGRYKGEDGES